MVTLIGSDSAYTHGHHDHPDVGLRVQLPARRVEVAHLETTGAAHEQRVQTDRVPPLEVAANDLIGQRSLVRREVSSQFRDLIVVIAWQRPLSGVSDGVPLPRLPCQGARLAA